MADADLAYQRIKPRHQRRQSYVQILNHSAMGQQVAALSAAFAAEARSDFAISAVKAGRPLPPHGAGGEAVSARTRR